MADMSVYKSTFTAEDFEKAIRAVPNIGENGNWFVGDQDTGVYAKSIDVTGAEVGQIIKVAEVDENGRPTAWEPYALENHLELLANVILEEEVSQIMADIPLAKYKRLFIRAYDVGTSNSAHDMFTAQLTIYKANGESVHFASMPSFINKGARTWYTIHCELTPTHLVGQGVGGRSANASANVSEGAQGYGMTVGCVNGALTNQTEISGISITPANSLGNGVFGVGSMLTVWGERV